MINDDSKIVLLWFMTINMFATILLIPFTVFVLIISYYFQQKWKWRSLSHINGPAPLPLLGNVLEFGLSPVAILNDLQRLLNNYGKKEGVVKISLGPNNCYLIIGDPDLTEFFLSSPKFLKKNADYDLFRPWIGNGLLTSTGTYWQKRRKAITPTFHFKILEQFVPIFNVGADTLIKRLSKEVDKDVDIYPYVTAYTLDSICETAMGTSVNAQDNPDNEYVQAVKNVCNIIISRTFSAWKGVDFLFQFTKECQLQKDYVKVIHNFTKSVIKERRNELLSASANNNAKEHKNEDDIGIKKRQAFLDLLLVSTIDGKPLTDEDITEEVDTFMFEGHDTTASAVCFALFELSRNPETQKKLYEEIKKIFHTDKERSPTLTELNDLKYLELVIKETLRLYPSVPFFARELQDDVTYKGTTFTKETQLVFFIYYMQRRPDLFTKPGKFEPERFLSENNTLKNPFSYVPFSAGPRNCIGQKFAMLEMKSVLSKIVRNFELLPVDKKYDVILSSEVILKSANGISLRLKKRV